MKFALFGKQFSSSFNDNIDLMFKEFQEYRIDLYIHHDFQKLLNEAGLSPASVIGIFDSQTGPPDDTDILISMGGDGTFLEAVRLVKEREIPILGINTGRLGFLANISRDDILESIRQILNGNYETEERSLLELNTSVGPLDSYNKALNEISIHKKDVSMISIHAELDGEFLNSYWADGLLISTPTGSTAYSMAVGGPIMLPESRSFIIAPVSPHNLTVRPLVIPDNKQIKLKVSSRSGKFLVAMDSHSYLVDTGVELNLKRSDTVIRMIKFPSGTFYNTLRNKLMWGLDRRN